jgi:hypothetical protein
MEAGLISNLASLGSAGAVIIALVYFWKLKAEADQKVLDRIDKIVDRHLSSEEANRQQIRELSEQNRSLFDRVINICMDLSNAVRELTSSTRANEKAIIDLRHEFRSLGGPQPHKAIGQEDPRPFGPG